MMRASVSGFHVFRRLLRGPASAATRRKRIALGGSTRFAVYQSLADYLRNGHPLLGALDALADVYGGHRAGAVLADWASRMRRGQAFPEIIDEALPTLEGSLITAGHAAANSPSFGATLAPGERARVAAERMAAGLDQAAEFGRLLAKLRGAILGILFTPALLTCEIIFSLWIIASKIGPVLKDIQRAMPGIEWPIITTSLIAANDVVQFALPVIGWVCGGYGLFAAATLTRYVGPARRYLDRLPPYSYYRAWAAATAFLNMAILVAAKTPVVEALEKATASAPAPLRGDLDALRRRARHGSLAEALTSREASRLLPPEYMRQVRAAAETNRFDESLPALAKSYITDIASRAERVARALAYVLMATSVANAIWVGGGMMALTGAISGIHPN